METLNAIIRFFQTGGVFMYPIVVVFALGAAIATERYLYLSWMALTNRRVWNHLQPLLLEGEYQAAMEYAVRSKAAVSTILTHGLNRAKSARRRHEVEVGELGVQVGRGWGPVCGQAATWLEGVGGGG